MRSRFIVTQPIDRAILESEVLPRHVMAPYTLQGSKSTAKRNQIGAKCAVHQEDSCKFFFDWKDSVAIGEIATALSYRNPTTSILDESVIASASPNWG